MAEPFKNMINVDVITYMASQFKKNWPDFDDKGFIKTATSDLDSLELKARTDQVTDSITEYLPKEFEEAGRILLGSLGSPQRDNVSTETADSEGLRGWPVIALAEHVARHGNDHFDLSMKLLKEMTKCATAEFAIRNFIQDSPKKTLSTLKAWTKDEDQHVRRLVSEGTRPRLPWASNLPDFIKDPSAVIELLELLKDDNEDYVRRSVANNLNDIAKDHPDLVAEIAARWIQNASQERKKLIRHACRTLIKNGHKRTLEILGYGPPEIHKTNIQILTPIVTLGESLEFTLSIQSKAKHQQALLIDYVVHHQKANGKTTPKVFKWRTTNLAPHKTIESTKRHAIKKITTRVYYPGTHSVEIMINGVSMGRADFQLVIPEVVTAGS